MRKSLKNFSQRCHWCMHIKMLAHAGLHPWDIGRSGQRYVNWMAFLRTHIVQMVLSLLFYGCLPQPWASDHMPSSGQFLKRYGHPVVQTQSRGYEGQSNGLVRLQVGIGTWSARSDVVLNLVVTWISGLEWQRYVQFRRSKCSRPWHVATLIPVMCRCI